MPKVSFERATASPTITAAPGPKRPRTAARRLPRRDAGACVRLYVTTPVRIGRLAGRRPWPPTALRGSPGLDEAIGSEQPVRWLRNEVFDLVVIAHEPDGLNTFYAH